MDDRLKGQVRQIEEDGRVRLSSRFLARFRSEDSLIAGIDAPSLMVLKSVEPKTSVDMLTNIGKCIPRYWQ